MSYGAYLLLGWCMGIQANASTGAASNEGEVPLHMASHDGRLEVVQTLLEADYSEEPSPFLTNMLLKFVFQ